MNHRALGAARRHVIGLISQFSHENRRLRSLTSHRGNLLNQHTRMAQSQRSLFANCTGFECVCVPVGGGGSERDAHSPICTTTSRQGHQKQIRRRGKWPREIGSGNSREQSAARRQAASHRADTDLHGGEFNLAPSLVKRLQIYTPPIQFVCRCSSGC